MLPGGSHLIVPGLRESDMTDPVKSIEDAARADSSGIVVDLEDGVAPAMKERARERTVEALAEWGETDRPVSVRMNGLETPHAFEDLAALHAAPSPPSAVVVPDVRGAADVRIVEAVLDAVDSPIGIVPLVERPGAVFDARAIAEASPRVAALAFGSVDFRRSLGMPTLDAGADVDLPRYVVSMAASAAGVPALDTVYLHREDLDGLRAETRRVRAMGFDGKFATGVEQVPVIEEAFTPSPEEVAHAERVVRAFREAGDDVGLIAVDGTTVDKPVVDEQTSLLARAKAAGLEVDPDLDLPDDG